MRDKISLLTILLLTTTVLSSTKIDLALPQKKSIVDESQLVKLAEEQKFVIPLNGRTISHSIEYIPNNSGECQLNEPTISYKSLAQTQAVFNNEDEIVNVLPLKTREIVIVADPFYNIASYSIDRHFLLKPKLPKTRLYKNNKGKESDYPMINPVLLATSNQQYIYYLTSATSFVFHYSNIASDIKQFKLEGQPRVIYKAIQKSGFVILCAGTSGILVYKIDQSTKHLKLIQQIVPKMNADTPVDMQLNQQTQLLYVLNYQKTIDIYLFETKTKQDPTTKQIQILTQYDIINLQNITVKHVANSNPYQLIGHKGIEISRDRVDQTLMILFQHGVKTVVAEISYQSVKKQYSFVRYFKYSTYIREIHVVEDMMVVVGSGILGMFPYGINPHLIVQEFNGFMTLTPIQRIVITQAPFFVGVSKNDIEFGGIMFNNQVGINCHLSSKSELKEIKFRANLTVCGELYPVEVGKYCQFEKTFIIKQMELTASAPVAASLWIATITFTLLIVIGLCCLFAIQKRKQSQIRKLQLYFEEKRRSVPASSDRGRQN